MKKNTFLGIDRTGKYCCILLSHLDLDTIKNHLADLEESDFEHDSTDWNGCDDYRRTLQIKNLELTGRSIFLPHCLVFSGTDNDMGHSYDWKFEVKTIAETNERSIK